MSNDQRYTYMARVLKAMAHPTRLFILDKLKQQDCCVGELRDLVGIDMSTMSRHLAILKEADIINSNKVNNQVFYHLLCPCVLDVYHCMSELKANRGDK